MRCGPSDGKGGGKRGGKKKGPKSGNWISKKSDEEKGTQKAGPKFQQVKDNNSILKKRIQGFFFPTGDHPQEDLAKFGYRLNTKVGNFVKSFFYKNSANI